MNTRTAYELAYRENRIQARQNRKPYAKTKVDKLAQISFIQSTWEHDADYRRNVWLADFKFQNQQWPNADIKYRYGLLRTNIRGAYHNGFMFWMIEYPEYYPDLYLDNDLRKFLETRFTYASYKHYKNTPQWLRD